EPSMVTSPGPVVGLASGVAGVDTGDFHTCALTTGGGVQCFGWNSYGQLGHPGDEWNSPYYYTPDSVVGLSGATKIVTADYHSCAIVAGGAVQCWGQGYYGQLGNGGSSSTTPVTVPGLSGVTSLALSSDMTCAVAGGGVKCWGTSWGM